MEDPFTESAQAPATFHQFLELPRELRDRVYEFAFGTELESSSIIWRREWRDRELERRRRGKVDAEISVRLHQPVQRTADGATYDIRPFPGCPFQQMIVSKRFYREAARAWLRTANLEFSYVERLESFITDCDRDLLPGIRKIHVSWRGNRYNGMFAENLKRCTDLHTLRITVGRGLTLKNKIDFIDELDKEDFKGLELVRDLLQTSSIRSLQLLPGEHEHLETPAEEAMWRKNLEALQKYVLRRLRNRQKKAERAKQMPEHSDTDTSAIVASRAAVSPAWECRSAAIQRQAALLTNATLEETDHAVNALQFKYPPIEDVDDDDDALENQTPVPAGISQSVFEILETMEFRVPGTNLWISGAEAVIVVVLLFNTVCAVAALFFALWR